MTNVPYNTNIPFASNSPSQDQPRMQENTNSIKALIEIDHVGFGQNFGGYHQDIHQPILPVGGQTAWNPVIGSGVPASVSAAAIVGIQQIFPLNYTPDTTGGTSDTQLFSMTGGGGISQLTGNSTAGISNGWCWIGGILIQWGTITNLAGFSGGDFGTLTFKDRVPGAIPFPNNCFLVVGNLNFTSTAPASSGTGNVTIDTATLSKTKFIWSIQTSSNKYTQIAWIALGN